MEGETIMPVLGGNAIDHNFAYQGQIADNQVKNIISKLNTSTVNIHAGSGVVRDGEQGVILPLTESTSAQFVGVVVRELNRVVGYTDNIFENIAKDMSVMTMGTIWVRVVVAVTAAQPAFLVVADGVNKGNFSNAAGTGVAAAVAIPNAIFLTAAPVGGLAKLSLRVGG